jgi:hypothetical protein
MNLLPGTRTPISNYTELRELWRLYKSLSHLTQGTAELIKALLFQIIEGRASGSIITRNAKNQLLSFLLIALKKFFQVFYVFRKWKLSYDFHLNLWLPKTKFCYEEHGAIF